MKFTRIHIQKTRQIHMEHQIKSHALSATSAENRAQTSDNQNLRCCGCDIPLFYRLHKHME